MAGGLLLRVRRGPRQAAGHQGARRAARCCAARTTPWLVCDERPPALRAPGGRPLAGLVREPGAEHQPRVPAKAPSTRARGRRVPTDPARSWKAGRAAAAVGLSVTCSRGRPPWPADAVREARWRCAGTSPRPGPGDGGCRRTQDRRGRASRSRRPGRGPARHDTTPTAHDAPTRVAGRPGVRLPDPLARGTRRRSAASTRQIVRCEPTARTVTLRSVSTGGAAPGARLSPRATSRGGQRARSATTHRRAGPVRQDGAEAGRTPCAAPYVGPSAPLIIACWRVGSRHGHGRTHSIDDVGGAPSRGTRDGDPQERRDRGLPGDLVVAHGSARTARRARRS